MSDYEASRQANIERNKALLQSLGLDQPFFEYKEKPKKASPKKRKLEDEQDQRGANKVQRKTESKELPSSGLRRSQRNVGKAVKYNEERVDPGPAFASVQSGLRSIENEGPLGRSAGSKRIHDPKQFGSIPGIEVGTWWETREGCSADAIHAPWVAGIAPSKNGAYSVALSGGYDDDVDLGYAFTYTGSGGRDLKGTKTNPKNLRTAPQSFDQSFEHNFNYALKRSVETKNPVRVIRGFKLKSPYSPSEGYRYDGLYRVEKAWMEEGLEGFQVCKYAFKRLLGQPPLSETGGTVAPPKKGRKRTAQKSPERSDESEDETGAEVAASEVAWQAVKDGDASENVTEVPATPDSDSAAEDAVAVRGISAA